MKKVALVTGASAGIGWDMAQYLNDKGFAVVGVARRLEKMDPLKEKGICTVQMDVGNSESVDAALAQIRSDVGEIDILINNAAIKFMGPAALLPMNQLRDTYDVNFFGLVDLTQKCLPHMMEKKWGKVINISSIGGIVPAPYNSSYSSAKFALESWSRTLKAEIRSLGVDVALVRPGAIKSDIFDSIVYQTEEELAWTGPWQDNFSEALARMKGFQEAGADPACVSQVVHDIINNEHSKVGYIVPVEDEEKMMTFLTKDENKRDKFTSTVEI